MQQTSRSCLLNSTVGENGRGLGQEKRSINRTLHALQNAQASPWPGWGDTIFGASLRPADSWRRGPGWSAFTFPISPVFTIEIVPARTSPSMLRAPRHTGLLVNAARVSEVLGGGLGTNLCTFVIRIALGLVWPAQATGMECPPSLCFHASAWGPQHPFTGWAQLGHPAQQTGFYNLDFTQESWPFPRGGLFYPDINYWT